MFRTTKNTLSVYKMDVATNLHLIYFKGHIFNSVKEQLKNWIDQMERDIFIASTVDLEDQIFFHLVNTFNKM